jgi:hypothetical protein
MMRKIIGKIANAVNYKHGERLLALDIDSREMQQRVKAMEAAFNLRGNYNVFIDFDEDTHAAIIFGFFYPIAYTYFRILDILLN